MNICETMKDNEFLMDQVNVLMTLVEAFAKLSMEQQKLIDNFMEEHEVTDEALDIMTEEIKDFNVRRVFNVHCKGMGINDILSNRLDIYDKCDELDEKARKIYKDNHDKINVYTKSNHDTKAHRAISMYL